MSALIIALFCSAALLALAAIALSAGHYAADWLALARQLECGGEVPRRHLVYARRLKQPPARRATARARRAARQPEHDVRFAAKPAKAPRKSVHNRYSGFGFALGSDKLVVE